MFSGWRGLVVRVLPIRARKQCFKIYTETYTSASSLVLTSMQNKFVIFVFVFIAGLKTLIVL